MSKYIFQEGGQTGDVGDSTDFFNNYIDQLTNQGADNTTIGDNQTIEEDSDFIKSLKEYSDEENGDDRFNKLNERLDNLDKILNEKILGWQMKTQQFDWLADDEGQDYLTKMFDMQNEDVDYRPSEADYIPSSNYKAGIAAGESGGNYFAANPQSGQTAFGKYQFIRSTRKSVYEGSAALQQKYKSFQEFENAFTGRSGKQEAVFAQETTMDEYTKKGESIHKNNPVAKALYHYSPKFAQMYVEGKLDLDKNPAYYGVGKGVKNPTFRSFLKSHKIIQ